jgi:hypothetical protein
MKVDGQKTVIYVQNKVELGSLHKFGNTRLPGKKLKPHLVASAGISTTQPGEYRGANIVGA